TRCGLQAFAVDADSGAIGGSSSHEFMIGAEVGEDSILLNADSGYAANIERADSRIPEMSAWTTGNDLKKIHTPNAGTIEEVVGFLRDNGHAEIASDRMLKTVLWIAQSTDEDISVAACLRGDRDVNEIKLSNQLALVSGKEILDLRPMNDDEVRAATSADPGFAGPGPGIKVDFCIADNSLEGAGSLVSGANETDHHLLAFQIERDAAIAVHFKNILLASAGDGCPISSKESGNELVEKRGIEVGHIFKLGQKYSTAMGAQFNNKDGKLETMTMGCYGIGTSRVAAAAIEQYHDDNGMKWPMPIAPYHCVILGTKKNDKAVAAEVQRIYDALAAAGVECIIDDRKLGPGVKFKDWDLIGIPLRLVVGRGFADGMIEVKQRDQDSEDVAVADVIDWALHAWRGGMKLSK
ncbi:MAG: proline--tRNA ligase, partial [Planctomycetes bacterium]|nr:proline--tRNA ligase [Planctomycetota bacterium]